jgi:hypothetical protein
MVAVFLGLALVTNAAYGAGKEPVIEVIDGKVTMVAEAVPLSRLLSLWDKAMGTASEVKPELANKTISAQFNDLDPVAAAHKMFQGQSLNYIVISGKGIRVYDLAQGGPATLTGTSPGYVDQPPPSSNLFVQPGQPVQQPVPTTISGQIQNPNPPQPNTANTIFGARPDPNVNPASPSAVMPGTPPPPIGATNPYTLPTAGPIPMNPPASQPSAPGTIPGVTPGTLK